MRPQLTTPLWVAILAHFTLNERLTRRKIFGVFLSLLGLYVLMGLQGVEDLNSAFIILAGAAVVSFANIIVKLWLGKCDMIQLTTWQMFFGALSLIVYSTVFPQGEIDWSVPAVLCLVYNDAFARKLGTSLELDVDFDGTAADLAKVLEAFAIKILELGAGFVKI